MRDVKRTVPMYSFYDRTGIQNYLETQAEKGWMLEKAGTLCWRFRRCEPRKLKFSVVYFPEADLYDPKPGEGEETFRDLCEHSGWKFAGSQAQMLIFYCTSLNPVPIDTDPVIEVQNIHKSMKKSGLLSYWLLMVSAVLQIVSQSLSLATDPIHYLSWNINLFMILFWPSMFLMCAGRIFFYYRWYRRAKRAAEDGEFLATQGSQKIEVIWAGITMALFVACAVVGSSKITAAIVIGGLVVGLGIVAVELGAREFFKKKGYDAAQNKVRTIVVTLIAVAVLMVVDTSMGFSIADRTGGDERYAIELSDLMDVEYKTLELEDNESILLGRQRIMQYTGRKYALQYQVVHVKAGFLLDFCREEILKDNYFEVAGWDAAPWNADEAYAFLEDDEIEGYMLYYGDYIVTLWPNWEMTEDQMAAIGDIFN